jgi:hypothetical protein
LTATLLISQLCNSDSDNDLWWHLKVGEVFLKETRSLELLDIFSFIRSFTDPFSFTAKELPWTNHEWLCQLLIAFFYEHFGSGSLIIGRGILIAFTVASFGELIRRFLPATNLTALLLLLPLFVVAMGKGWGLRPQLFSYTFLPILFLIISSNKAWHALTISLLFSLWANLHGAFVVGIGVLGLNVLLTYPRYRAFLRAVLFLLGGFIGTLMTPYGFSLYSYIFAEIFIDHPITEWLPLNLFSLEHLPILITFLLLLGSIRSTWNTRDTLLRGSLLSAILFFLLALKSQRHTPIFMLFALLPIGLSLTPFSNFLKSASRHLIVIIIVFQISLSIFRGLLLINDVKWPLKITYSTKDYPAYIVKTLKEIASYAKRPLNLSLPLEWGGYILYHNSPDIKVSLDGRFATLYNSKVIKANFDLIYGLNLEDNILINDGLSDLILLPLEGAKYHFANLKGYKPIAFSNNEVLFMHKDLPLIFEESVRKYFQAPRILGSKSEEETTLFFP